MIACYCRVSTQHQKLDSQRSEIEKWLNASGVDLDKVEWYLDHESGTKLERPAFQRLQADIFRRKISTVVVWKLDRISRRLKDGVNVLSDWCEQGIRVVAVTQQIELTGAVGRMMAAVMLGLAEIEMEYRRERQAAGIEVARKKGAYKGRKPGSTKGRPERACELHANGLQDGLYHDVAVGVSLGCSLSPLMGALYLKPVDDLFRDSELFYARFMDDWVILSPSRWKLRRAVAEVNEVLDTLKVKQHPDKTFIGRTCRGFDFLGYQFEVHGRGLNVSARAIANRDERIHRLYEQGAGKDRIGDYVRRWWSWAKGGLQPITRLVPIPEFDPITHPVGVAATAVQRRARAAMP